MGTKIFLMYCQTGNIKVELAFYHYYTKSNFNVFITIIQLT